MTATERAMASEEWAKLEQQAEPLTAAATAYWHGKVRELEADNERLRLALISVWSFLRLEAGKDHKVFGLACGIDACILCLAEETAKQALQLPPASDDSQQTEETP